MAAAGAMDELSREDFDVKSWVNGLCASQPDGEPLDRYLAEMELRLHLNMEDLDAFLEDESVRAMQSLPGALQEVARLQEDLVSLKVDVERVSRQLQSATASVEKAVSPLVQLDHAKTRLEEACSTLKEATELTEIMGNVESVFNSGNPEAMVHLLKTMRHSLALVGGVPEFEGGHQRAEELEQRFRASVEPQLSEALLHGEGDKVQRLVGYLTDIGCEAVLTELYLATRAKPLQRLWEAHQKQGAGESAALWLPGFYQELLAAVVSEESWVAQNLPEQHPALLARLLAAFFAQIQQALTSHIWAALSGDSVPLVKTLMGLVDATNRLLEGLAHPLASLLSAQLRELFDGIAAPVQSQLERYSDFELRQLTAELATLELPPPSEARVEPFLSALRAVVPEAHRVCQAACARCGACTEGAELPALALVVDKAMQAFVLSLEAQLRSLAGALPLSPDSLDAEAPAFLPLLHIATGLQAGVGETDARVREGVRGLAQLLQRTAERGGDLAVQTNLRLRRLQGQKAAELRAAVAAAECEAFTALPQAAEAASSFAAAVQDLIYDILISKLKADLAVVPGLAAWRAAEAEGQLLLPSFSAYPQPYATAAGEYLMLLPQQLEVMMGLQDGEGDEGIDADWIDKVSDGAAQLYEQQLLQIPAITVQGCQQLAADLDYFCNVLSALGVGVTPGLATWRVALQWPAAEFWPAARAALEDGMVEEQTLHAVARIRHIEPGQA